MNTQKVTSKMKKFSIPTSANCTFSQLTTLAVGGKIELTIFPQQTSQLISAIRYLKRNKIPFCIIGKGSNILASDNHFDGVVVSTKNLNSVVAEGHYVTAQCGAPTAKVAQLCVAKGLTGCEFLACLPASVGGVTACNAGCFGQCASDIVHSVKVLDNGVVKRFTREQCCFAYRNSIFKNGNFVILEVTFCFQPSTPTQVTHKIQWMKTQKSKTQPLGAKTAGCVLYNEQFAVSRLVDQAGLKGYQVGQAKVSKKHAGFVINIDKATSKDIYLLIRHIQQVLYKTYNVNSRIELNLVNFTEDKNDIFTNDQTGNSQNPSSH